jgi:hypothetical protein
VAGVDPESGRVTRLFHPRRDAREEHFGWEAETLVGLSAIGRATIAVLRLNHPLRLIVRRSLLREGVPFH